MSAPPVELVALVEVLRGLGRVAVAVSGGVDSTTLAVVAHRTLPARAEVFHAVSPAVPPEATERVRRHAEREGWRWRRVDAGEMDDPDYRRNPVDRCFYCKRDLYAAIARHTDAPLVSGTNRDDLDDFRPGLEAARRHGVRHPYVEAGIDKAAVRAIARHLALDDLAELPASPCLSSRIETGLAIEPERLELVHAVERAVAERLRPATVRCRVRRGGVVVELDAASLDALGEAGRAALADALAGHLRSAGVAGAVELAPYRRGSAFVRLGAGGGLP